MGTSTNQRVFPLFWGEGEGVFFILFTFLNLFEVSFYGFSYVKVRFLRKRQTFSLYTLLYLLSTAHLFAFSRTIFCAKHPLVKEFAQIKGHNYFKIQIYKRKLNIVMYLFLDRTKIRVYRIYKKISSLIDYMENVCSIREPHCPRRGPFCFQSFVILLQKLVEIILKDYSSEEYDGRYS